MPFFSSLLFPTADNAPTLTMETEPAAKPPAAPSAEASDAPSNGSPTENGSVASPQASQSQDTYSTDLFTAFPKVCQKAKSGVLLCQAVSAFVTERATAESSYAQSLLKLAQSAKAEDWSPQLTECWAIFQEATEHLAQERWSFASTLQTSIVPGAKAFATQQEIQVQRLITEGTKVRWAQHQMTLTMDKAREKYERKCQEAIEMTASIRRSENGEGSASASSTPDSSDDISSSSKELTDKLAAGAGQLLTKMWDTTSAFGRSPLERQRSKLFGCLEEVIAAEKHYVQTVEYTNAQRLIFEREIKDNLHAFQLTEEQRMEYLKDVLMRMQKAFIGVFSRSKQYVERMKNSANRVDELADIEKGFQSLGSQEEVDVDQADLSTNPFYHRMMHIQAMSDNGQRMIGVINTVVIEFIATESRFSQSLRKLLRVHESGGLAPPSDLFGAASPNAHAKFMAEEGATMANAWMTVRDQVKLLLEVHQEFQSLLAEPVSLSLSTMKTEYESVRNSTQENFLKTHSTLSNESSAHRKLQQKLMAKSRDFAVTFSHMPGATPVSSSSHGIEVGQALKALTANIRSFSEKDRRSEAKLRQLAEEIKQLQTRAAESSSSLRQTYQIYVQEIEVSISTYMKNEKYRLQVGKNSLQSLAKAVEHMLKGGASVGNKALSEFEKINPNSDITEFIRVHRQPYERCKRIVPVYHGNDSLKEVMREYLASVGASASMPPENSEKIPRSPTSASFQPASIPNGENPSSPEQSPRSSISQKTDDQIVAANGSFDVDDDEPDDDKSAASVEQDEDDSDTQPLGVSDFQKRFKLDQPEQVVESYSCALFLSNFPYHGRLYLTRDRMCFSGWRDTVYVAAFSEVSAMEKKNTALVVPNAIEFTVKGEKIFFASFIFRDECYQSIQQLRSIKKETEALLSDPSKFCDSEQEEATESQARRRRSSSELAAVSPAPEETIDRAQKSSAEDSRSASSSEDATAEPIVPGKDEILGEYDLLLDEEVAFSVDTVYSKLWVESDAFSRKLLEAAGSTNISIPSWDKTPVSYTAVTKPDNFDGSRSVTYTHNKKYMVGPSVIPTTQAQRYAYTSHSYLVVSTTTCVSDVPYCDYFRVEHRWVFSATKKQGVSFMQVGLRIQWIKNTWLKKQIEGTTVSEAKESAKGWLRAALAATREQTTGGRSVSSSVSPSAKTSPAVTGEPSKEVQQDASTGNTAPAAFAQPTSNSAISQLHPTIRAAVIICTLMFIYTMYRVCAAMDQMQELTREALIQQQQQQEFLKELLGKLNARN